MAVASRQQVLFTPGPVNLHPAIKARLFEAELSHRQPEFEDLRRRVAARLFTAAGLSRDDHRLSLLHGSGTLAVDAGLTSLVRGSVMVVDNGVYGERVLTTLEPLPGVRVHRHAAGLGRPPQLDELELEVERNRPDWIAVVHHETTTGLLNPLTSIADLAERAECRLFVDAVSSLGAHPLDPRADVICFNSNKCLESLPGVAGVFWRRELEPHRTVPVLDVTAYADAIPSTPNVQAFLALDIALDLLAAEDRPARYARLARRVWEAGGRRFEPLLAEADRSHVLTSFRLGGHDPGELFRRALEHGYVIYRGQGSLRDEIFRVANLGWLIDEEVIDDLFSVLGR
jgi:2-aminoethylphosphonate-pyruvate transaminase